MGMEKLDARSLDLLLANWPELGSILPRPVTSQHAMPGGAPASLSEPAAAYGPPMMEGRERSMLSGELLSERYMRLLERYTALLEKHLEVVNHIKTA
jgi:hypothetical protein